MKQKPCMCMKVKLAIVGSRGFQDYDALVEFIDRIIKENDYEVTEVISGGAKGADRLGELWARTRGYPIIIYQAEWDKYGKSAGFRRNYDIIQRCDIVFAFWDGESKGTKHDLELAEKFGKQIFLYNYGKY